MATAALLEDLERVISFTTFCALCGNDYIDGLHYVDSVTHNIKHGEFKQSFSLSRDGLISATPVVPI